MADSRMTTAMTQRGTLVLSRTDVARNLPMNECIDAVERAFLKHARGETIPPGVLGAHVTGGGFHVKSAGLPDAIDGKPLFVVKINANFPGNPDQHGLPTIQGVVAVFDASNGRILALLDSMELTVLRTAAATAVAARYLAPEASSVAIVGCGAQARAQLRALACVRPFKRVDTIDVNIDRVTRFSQEISTELDVEVRAVSDPSRVSPDTNIWITCTPSTQWILGRNHVRAGSFISAVGADSHTKQEIEPELLAANVVIADLIDQCAAIGDLHHALSAGLMTRDNVRAELAHVVSGEKRGRLSDNEIVIYDSTGTALQDVAAAAVVYQHAMASGDGVVMSLGGVS